jgi:3-oxoacyl-[acyl-carrier protein] reductase
MTQTGSGVAIVTGGSRGIGRATAERLAADGFAIAVNYAGNKAKAEETAGAIKAAGGNAVAIAGDVSKEADVAKIYEGMKQAFGRVDVVVANAGIMTLSAIAEGKVEEFDRIIAINLRGMYLMMWQAAKHLDRGGRFIAISTGVIGRNLPTYGAYIASKSGVEGLVRVFATASKGHWGNIRTTTRSTRKVAAEGDRAHPASGQRRAGHDRSVCAPPAASRDGHGAAGAAAAHRA